MIFNFAKNQGVTVVLSGLDQLKLVCDPVLAELLEERGKLASIIFGTAIKEGFWGLIFGELLNWELLDMLLG